MQQPGVGMPGLQMPHGAHGGPDQDEMQAAARRQLEVALQPQAQQQQQMLMAKIGQMQQFMDGVQVHGQAQDTHGVSAPPCATAAPARPPDAPARLRADGGEAAPTGRDHVPAERGDAAKPSPRIRDRLA